MTIIKALIALAPIILKLLDLLIKDDKEKFDEYVKGLPEALKKIKDDNTKASQQKDPSIINRNLNRR